MGINDRIDLEVKGFTVLEDFLSVHEVEALRLEADRFTAVQPRRGGTRHLLGKSKLFRLLARDRVDRLATRLLGPRARVVMLTLFDKTPQANWKVPWHQDLTISVERRIDTPGFGPWSVKDGLPHVQPPARILEQAVALRIHLDSTPELGGALRVLKGSHLLGKLSKAQVDRLCEERSEMICPVPCGGVMAMKPLLLHASSAAKEPSHRRVLHFVYSDCCLPNGLAWSRYS